MSLRALFAPVSVGLRTALIARSFRTAAVVEEQKTLYVGNLPWGAEEDRIRELFASHGEIIDVHTPRDPIGRTRGFAFVRMEEESIGPILDAQEPLEMDGRALNISVARERAPRPAYNRDDRSNNRSDRY